MLSTHQNIEKKDLLQYFPIGDPFRFIDSVDEVDENHIVGTYTFKEEDFFFKGHFPGTPVAPGSILMEAGAQIGLVAFGMYLLGNNLEAALTMDDGFVNIPEIEKLPAIEVGGYKIRFYLVESEMRFKKVIQPRDKIVIRSEKQYFKLNKLKCNVVLKTADGALVAKGVLAGMVHIQKQDYGK